MECWRRLELERLVGYTNSADIYVLGFQEIVPLNAGNVLGVEDKGAGAKWLSLIRSAFNRSHKMDPTFVQHYGRSPLPAESPLPCDWQRIRKHRVSFSDLLSLDDDELEEEYEDFAGELDSRSDCFDSHEHGENGYYCLAPASRWSGSSSACGLCEIYVDISAT